MGITVHIVDSSLLNDAVRFRSLARRTLTDVVIHIGAACGGAVQAIADARNATQPASIDALVIYGHGVAGVQGVSMGKDGNGIAERAAITAASLDSPDLNLAFRMLAPHFSPQGMIVLRGCNVAEGQSGKALLSKLARITGVPVKGSDWYQATGRTGLSGNVITASPGGAIVEDRLEGLKHLGGLPPEEGLILLAAEGYQRFMQRFGR